MAVIQGNAHKPSVSGAVTQQSLKFNDDESQYLSWTPAAAGNRKTWTWSGWAKRGNLDVTTNVFGSGPDGDNQCAMIFSSTGVLQFRNEVSNSIKIVQSTALFRDPSAFYHIVAVYDSSNSTTADRMRLYVNGERITDFSNEVQPSLNLDSFMNSSSYEMFIGKQRSDATNYFDGYLSDINFIDGQALDASSFGQFTNGYWEKKDYAGSYGTNGFHLTFQDDVVSEGFNSVAYRGNGTSQSVSGLGLSPDLVWVKERTNTSNHVLTDTVRGAGPILSSNATNDENAGTGQYLQSFDSDGFTIGNSGAFNAATDTYVAWAWDAGSGSAASNTDGSITSTVKANPAYGFSIISYTGNSVNNATIGTGLNSEAEMVIIKNRTNDTASDSWPVWHKDIGTGKYLSLSTANAATTSGVWNDGGFTNDVISISSWNGINKSGTTYIGYAFHSVANYSSISSYSGTASANNAVTGLGFKPAWIMIKKTSGTDDWCIYDSTRNPSASTDTRLEANDSAAEVSGSNIEITFDSDGFTLVGTGSTINASGGTYIYMAFADTREAAFWKDVSGQGNHWTPNNLDYRDSVVDSPANNFATLNPLDKDGHTNAEGNLKVSGNVIYGHQGSTFSVTSGKWYFESVLTTQQNDTAIALKNQNADTDAHYTGQTTDSVGYVSDGRFFYNGSSTSYASYGTGDVAQIAFDADAGKIWIGKNNTWQNSGNPVAGTGEVQTVTWNEFIPATRTVGSGTMVFNFGQDSTFSGTKPMGAYTDDNSIGNFQYAPPAGYLALCTANLPTPSIVDGSENFVPYLYTADNTSPKARTGVGFAADFLWFKDRTTGFSNGLYDTVRGPNKQLQTNNTSAESSYTLLPSFDADGFTTQTDGTAGNVLNYSTDSYVTWAWKAGGTAVSNTDGSITSQVSANTDAGFSIATFTAPTSGTCTVGHGLDVAPECFFIKSRANAYGWTFYHKSIGADKYLVLNSTSAQATDSNTWNNTTPTSSVFTLGLNFQNTSTWVGYCFHSVEGYSKVGSYVGNGSADGTFVYTGFRPAWIMIKKSSAGGDNWTIYDTARDPDNVAREYLIPNSSQAAASTDTYDILSNGFKIRTSGAWVNTSGQTFIYLAFAETPFKYANAR